MDNNELILHMTRAMEASSEKTQSSVLEMWEQMLEKNTPWNEVTGTMSHHFFPVLSVLHLLLQPEDK